MERSSALLEKHLARLHKLAGSSVIESPIIICNRIITLMIIPLTRLLGFLGFPLVVSDVCIVADEYLTDFAQYNLARHSSVTPAPTSWLQNHRQGHYLDSS